MESSNERKLAYSARWRFVGISIAMLIIMFYGALAVTGMLAEHFGVYGGWRTTLLIIVALFATIFGASFIVCLKEFGNIQFQAGLETEQARNSNTARQSDA